MGFCRVRHLEGSPPRSPTGIVSVVDNIQSYMWVGVCVWKLYAVRCPSKFHIELLVELSGQLELMRCGAIEIKW